MKKSSFKISEISCGHCVAAIQKELSELEGVVRIEGDPGAKTVAVAWELPATEARIKEKLAEIGYPAAS
jgi:copper chaperone CopZ